MLCNLCVRAWRFSGQPSAKAVSSTAACAAAANAAVRCGSVDAHRSADLEGASGTDLLRDIGRCAREVLFAMTLRLWVSARLGAQATPVTPAAAAAATAPTSTRGADATASRGRQGGHARKRSRAQRWAVRESAALQVHQQDGPLPDPGAVLVGCQVCNCWHNKPIRAPLRSFCPGCDRGQLRSPFIRDPADRRWFVAYF